MGAPIVAAHHEGSTALQGRSASDTGKLLRSMEDARREVQLRHLKLDQSAARRPLQMTALPLLLSSMSLLKSLDVGYFLTLNELHLSDVHQQGKLQCTWFVTLPNVTSTRFCIASKHTDSGPTKHH